MSVSTSRPLHGEVDLALPRDLVDLMVPTEAAQAREVFESLFHDILPRASAEQTALLADGLLAWRDMLLADGVVLHGIVAGPAGPAVDVPAHWHILAGVVDVGVTDEIDAAEVTRRFLGQELSPDGTYTETFETAMGWGVGVITQVPLTPRLARWEEAAEHVDLPTAWGLAAGLAAPRDGRHGLLVVGICLDTERTLDMAALVAGIAGSSVIRLKSADEQEKA